MNLQLKLPIKETKSQQNIINKQTLIKRYKNTMYQHGKLYIYKQ